MVGAERHVTMLLGLLLLLSASPTHALEITSCSAELATGHDNPSFEQFMVTAKLKNEKKTKFKMLRESATQSPQVVMGFFHHGDCSGAGGAELGAELSGDIAPGKTGTAKASVGFLKHDRGKAKLVLYVNADPENEKYAAGLNGPNCSFEKAAIINPKKWKVCALKKAKN
jgi:hypothetical protein